MRITSRSRTTHTLYTEDDGEVDLEFEPYGEDDVLCERVGDKLVVAYLVHDPDASFNPLKDYDCQGNLYTKSRHYARESTITDNDSEFYSALGLDNYGGIDIDKEVTLDGRTESLRTLAAEQVRDGLDHDDWCALLLWCFKYSMDLTPEEVIALENEECSPQRLAYLKGKHWVHLWEDLQDERGIHSDRLQAVSESLYEQHWQQIAGPYVVPVASTGGSYETRYSPTTWDGDTSDLPDGVWVADKGARENIGEGYHKGVVINRGSETYKGPKGWIVEADGRKVAFFPDNGVANGQYVGYTNAKAYVEKHYGDRLMDVHTAAVHYADGVLEEYSSWCSGDVYGCVVQKFTLGAEPEDSEAPTWVPEVDHDSCWGFIGHDYAVESLKSDYFDPVVKALRAKEAA